MVNFALKKLVRRDYAYSEISRLLLQKFDHNLVDRALEFLISNNYLNQERFIEMFVRKCFHQGYGPNYIRQALSYQYQIDVDKSVFDDYDWLARLTDLYHKKHKSPLDIKAKNKLKQFFIRKGFSTDLVFQVIR